MTRRDGLVRLSELLARRFAPSPPAPEAKQLSPDDREALRRVGLHNQVLELERQKKR